jgi:threonine aldolase
VNTIDFRSDTVTWPTPAMREAMAQAAVGDDVYQEDPTVNALEARAAEMLGKEAGLFVASGTMGNLTAILTHAGRGDEAILGVSNHTYCWEAGGMATLGGIVPHPLPVDATGRLDPAAVRAAVRGDDPHLPRSRLLLLENSYGAFNGYPLPAEYFATMRAAAAEAGLRVHIDGARFFNAAVALGVDPAALAADADSLSFCLSKGLCAPVGSVLVGSHAFIKSARRWRKALGGGMRQAGVLAAAGLVALEQMVDRLAEDHRHARRLADQIAAIPGLRLHAPEVRTNMVMFELQPALQLAPQSVIQRLRDDFGILLGDKGTRGFRAVTHYWIGQKEIDQLATALREIVLSAPISA